jgi:predicted RecB family nuclease
MEVFMRLLASDIITFCRPEPCGRRFLLQRKGIPAAEPSDYDQVLARLGDRHEQEHLKTLGRSLDLSAFRDEELLVATKGALQHKTQVIYQGAFQVVTTIQGQSVTIFGKPDFLIFEDGGYVIRDAKLSRKIDDEHHVEIACQLQLYGWLYEKTTGVPPKRLEVHNGMGEISPVPYDGGTAALTVLAEVFRWKNVDDPPYVPVGWTKCNGCSYGDYCIEEATAAKDVAILPEVDQNLARALHDRGVADYPTLRKKFDVASLSEFKRPWGQSTQKVGKRAEKILVYAEVMESGQERVLAPPAIPDFPNFVMFDLEGLPPQQNDLEKIYLWGLQVYGQQPSEFIAAIADFGTNGDQAGWEAFLTASEGIFAQHGDIPFVHWAPYEKTNVNRYITRFGDPKGIAARVLKNLLDLLPITKASIALPIPSYGLKVIEKYVGFERTTEKVGGDWAIAAYIEATETNDAAKRNELMAAIKQYNKEDLAATWAVFEWLRGKMWI